MNPASQPDTPSEWSKFSPLPPRLRSQTALPESANSAAATPSSTSVLPDTPTFSTTTDTPNSNLTADANESAPSDNALEQSPKDFPDHFLCQSRKCQERRERRHLAPQHLFRAHWRPMKIGKRYTQVLDLTISCPDCGYEHHDTLVPPEWEEVSK